MEKKEKESQLNKSEDLAFKLLDRVLKLEQAHGGPRGYWFRQGLVTAASVVVFATVPQYRILTGTWTVITIADSIFGLGVVKWAENRIRKQQEDFLKKYPNPQAFIQDLLRNGDVQPNLRVVKDKKDIH